MGTPIPLGSIGAVIDSVISNLPSKQKIYGLYYNTMHLATHCKEHIDNVQNYGNLAFVYF